MKIIPRLVLRKYVYGSIQRIKPQILWHNNLGKYERVIGWLRDFVGQLYFCFSISLLTKYITNDDISDYDMMQHIH